MNLIFLIAFIINVVCAIANAIITFKNINIYIERHREYEDFEVCIEQEKRKLLKRLNE